MGFTVLGPNRFLGSGHPDASANLPPLLGLIESKDGGRSWTPVALLGQADFHVLRARGARIVGYDAPHQRLMISRDGGRRWRAKRLRAPLFDLAVDPHRPYVFAATRPDGLLLSRDSGGTWTRVTKLTGLVAWPRPRLLYVDPPPVGRPHPLY